MTKHYNMPWFVIKNLAPPLWGFPQLIARSVWLMKGYQAAESAVDATV
jgi:hypothetical protein